MARQSATTSAIGSPTYVTSPTASNSWFDVKFDGRGGERQRNAIGCQQRAQVSIRQDGVHAGQGLRCRRIDVTNARMS